MARRNNRTATATAEACRACDAARFIGTPFCDAHVPARTPAEWWLDVLIGMGACDACDAARLIGMGACDRHATPTATATATAEAARVAGHALLAAQAERATATMDKRDAASGAAERPAQAPGARSGVLDAIKILATLDAPDAGRGVNPGRVTPAMLRALDAYGRECRDDGPAMLCQYDHKGRAIPQYVARVYTQARQRGAYTQGEVRWIAAFGRSEAIARMAARPGYAASATATAERPAQAPTATATAERDAGRLHALHSALSATGYQRLSYARYAAPDGTVLVLATRDAAGDAKAIGTARRIGRRARYA